MLILSLLLATIMYVLLKQRKLKPKALPRILGVGGGIFWFAGSMTASILLWPKSEFIDYTIANFLWSLAAGVVCYFSGRIFARRFGK